MSNSTLANNAVYSGPTFAGAGGAIYNYQASGTATLALDNTILANTPVIGFAGDATNNGGPTWTHALAACSPAIDAVVSGPVTDQRGAARLRGVAFDIGAFEPKSPPSCNTAPVANDDSYTTDEDAPLIVPAPGVLGNDTDVDNSTLTAILVSGPGLGTLKLNADGSFTYIPAASYNGADSFTYKAYDGALYSNVAAISRFVSFSADMS